MGGIQFFKLFNTHFLIFIMIKDQLWPKKDKWEEIEKTNAKETANLSENLEYKA